MKGFYVPELETLHLTPGKKSNSRPGIGVPGICIPDVGREELDEAFFSFCSSALDDGRNWQGSGGGERCP